MFKINNIFSYLILKIIFDYILYLKSLPESAIICYHSAIIIYTLYIVYICGIIYKQIS